eukprot:1144728-Pelagomonas_calceolata.AAC.3
MPCKVWGPRRWCAHSWGLVKLGAVKAMDSKCHCMVLPPDDADLPFMHKLQKFTMMSHLLPKSLNWAAFCQLPECAPCASCIDFSCSLPNLGKSLVPRPRPPDPPNYAPGQVPNCRCWSGKPGMTSWRPHFGRDVACYLVPHPGTPLAQTEYAGLLRYVQLKGWGAAPSTQQTRPGRVKAERRLRVGQLGGSGRGAGFGRKLRVLPLAMISSSLLMIAAPVLCVHTREKTILRPFKAEHFRNFLASTYGCAE